MPKSPTVNITLDKPYTIEFDLACIQRIEESTGLGCFELQEKLSDLFAGMPVPTKENPAPELSDDQAKTLAKKVRIGFGISIIAGAIDKPVSDAKKLVELDRFIPTLFSVVAGFTIAMILLGSKESDEAEGGAEGNVGGVAEGSPPTG